MLDIAQLRDDKVDDVRLPSGRIVPLYPCDAKGYRLARQLRVAMADDTKEAPADEDLLDLLGRVLPDVARSEIEAFGSAQIIGLVLSAGGLADQVMALIAALHASEETPEGNALTPGEQFDPATTTSKA